MPDNRKMEYHQLEVGYEFPPASFQLDSVAVARYLSAVEDSSDLYQGGELVPPMAVAANAMAALSDSISLPPGSIHVSQELEFISDASTQDTITSYARLSRKRDRGRLHIVMVEFNVYNQKEQLIINGKTSFTLPQPEG